MLSSILRKQFGQSSINSDHTLPKYSNSILTSMILPFLIFISAVLSSILLQIMIHSHFLFLFTVRFDYTLTRLLPYYPIRPVDRKLVPSVAQEASSDA